jgi:hypothetical protein
MELGEVRFRGLMSRLMPNEVRERKGGVIGEGMEKGVRGRRGIWRVGLAIGCCGLMRAMGRGGRR